MEKRVGWKSVAFFHPSCCDGGGGERVLWKMVENMKGLDVVIYCQESDENIIRESVKHNFDITLDKDVRFVRLKMTKLLDPELYPFLRIVGQSLGSIILSLEALWKFRPDFYFDTSGYAFTFPVFYFLGRSVVLTYIHYPTVSDAMMEGGNPFRRIYYQCFSFWYRLVGKLASVVVVNSSWTRYHMQKQWNPVNKKFFLLYPPVNTSVMTTLQLDVRSPYLISLGRFRPEKNHELQIELFSDLLKSDFEKKLPRNIKLILIGSLRPNNLGDQERLAFLKRMVEQEGLVGKVEFLVGLGREELCEWLGKGLIGLHTMREEHFGIGIVEMMASGLIPVVHDSGGPMFDIVTSQEVGFRAKRKEDYISAIKNIFRMTGLERRQLQENVRERSFIFTDTEFQRRLNEVVKPCWL